MKIAAVVPCYNSANTIVQTLKSITQQSFQCHEIIVIDDGSTDGTETRARSIEGVKYYRQENAGVSAARNKGVEIAESDWIAFCDADDLWHAKKMEIIVKCIQSNPDLRFLYHDFSLFSEDEGVIHKEERPSTTTFPFFLENRITPDQMFEKSKQVAIGHEFNDKDHCCVYIGNVFKWLILGNFILPTTTVIRKDTFLDSGGFDVEFRIAEDTEFFLRLARLTIFGFVDLPLASYRKSALSITGSSSNRLTLLRSGQKALVKNCMKDKSLYEKFGKTINLSTSRRYARMSYLHLSEFEKTEARRLAIASIKYCPSEKRGWLYLLASMMPRFLLKTARKLKAGW